VRVVGTMLDSGPYLQRLSDEIARVDRAAMQRWSDLIYDAWQQQRFVFLIGNGGSGLTASHICEDLGKGTLSEPDLLDESKQRLKVLSLTDNAGWIMAIGNDLAYDQIFVQQLMNFASAGDALIAISGSGNSPNILKAVDWANRHGLKPSADRLRRRTTEADSAGRTASGIGRHGDGRKPAPVPAPLGPERRFCPHEPGRSGTLAVKRSNAKQSPSACR
jgi:D-sedoheptulose 7-phosphate isomerase